LSPFRSAALSLVLASALWIVVFLVRPLGFWPSLSISTLVLLIVAIAINRERPSLRLTRRAVLIGIATGALLYLLFFAGYQVTKANPIFNEGVGQVYELRTVPSLLIGLALIFPIGPGEEIYWRGLIQRRISERFGTRAGLLTATAAYTLVHLPTLNLPLMLTAFIGGLTWGYVYQKTASLLPVIISHVLFDLLIFVIVPLA
jgi:membrane protease YdiL (CAAX protease family)